MDELFEKWFDQYRESAITIDLLRKSFEAGYIDGQNVAAQALANFRTFGIKS